MRRGLLVMTSFYKKVLWYIKKHGLKSLILLSLTRLWETIDNKEVVFLSDLNSMALEMAKDRPSLSVQAYKTPESIPKEDMDQLIRLKSKDILNSILQHLFEKGATLWIAKVEDRVVGLTWTLIGGFDGFYSVPIPSMDAIWFAQEVFSEARGQGIAGAMRGLIFKHLAQQGVSRIYAKVHYSNVSQLRSMDRTGNIRIGMVRTFKVLNRLITIWG
jgi:hypothetical protein